MANNKIYVKRTSTSGNIPTTAQIANGELAVNMTDGILYSTNGSVVFAIGANLVNQRITGGANAIILSNATQNWFWWNTVGVAIPSVTTRSAGTKLALYPSLSGTQVDYAIGIESNHMWFSTDNVTTGCKWYANTTNYMTSNVAGLYHTGVVNGSSHTVGSSFIANATGVYHTGTINAASHTVGTSFTANSTLTNTVSLVVSTNTATIGTGTYFVSNGNVGIGTASPAYKLDVVGIVNTTDQFRSIGTGGDFRFNGGFGGTVAALGTVDNKPFMMFTNNTERVRVDASGNVGIGTASPGYKLEVNGAFAATTKSFVIDHPSKKGMKLRHGSLEGPENGVYVRGRTNTNIIELPDYWVKLIDKDSITVSLTAIGKTVCPSVGKITNKKINLIGNDIDCFFHVFAERKDVEKLVVEY
jgi:hypothetical protein